MPRKIVVLTGTRAEYGLLYWTMRELQKADVDLSLIVTGAHLSADHGMTVKQIEADGFPITARVDMKLASDMPLDIAKSMGVAVSGIAQALSEIKPDIAVILGDRYEMLAAASAASMLKIPIAHIQGGEVTEGAMDESIRHAITKLSYWHFATTEPYRQRIVQLGEDPARVFMVGAPGVDNIALLPLLSKEALTKELGIPLASPVILFTYHPETLSVVPAEKQIDTVIAALGEMNDCTIIITGANADSGGRTINQKLQAFAVSRTGVVFRMSFGSLLYLSAMKACDVVVGNSSSGVIEAPVMGKAVVNIGNRQAGRIRTPSVIDVGCASGTIVAGIKKALSREFQAGLKPSGTFGKPGEVGRQIAKKLVELKVPASLGKSFHDL